MAAGRAQFCIERYWEVVGELSIGTNPDPLTIPQTPKLGISKTTPLNYGQTVADGATL